MGASRIIRSLSFLVGKVPPPLLGLLGEFRLIVNKSIRIALREDIRSRVRLARVAYGGLSAEHDVYKQYIPSAFEVALGVLKVYRRRMRKGKRSSVPFMRRLMLKAENQSYRLDRETGRLRIPIRGTEGGESHPSRLHVLSKRLVQAADSRRAAIVLEDLTLHGAGGRSRKMNRRLSSWPRGEIHRQIEYKAALAGVPLIKVNPQWTSKTCPACGARRRDRVGKEFVCLMCDWEMDRQINAGMNILKSALASNEALARALRFQPGALRHDVVSPLYDLLERGGAREEPSGVESQVGMMISPDS